MVYLNWIQVVSEPSLTKSGVYWSWNKNSASFENQLSQEASDAEKAKKVWEISEKLVGLVWIFCNFTSVHETLQIVTFCSFSCIIVSCLGNKRQELGTSFWLKNDLNCSFGLHLSKELYFIRREKRKKKYIMFSFWTFFIL